MAPAKTRIEYLKFKYDASTIVLPIKSTATVSQLRSELCNAVNYNDKAIVASAAAGLDDHLDAGSASTATAEKKPDELCFWTQATPGSVGAGSEEQVEWTRLEGDEDDDGLTIDKWRVADAAVIAVSFKSSSGQAPRPSIVEPPEEDDLDVA